MNGLLIAYAIGVVLSPALWGFFDQKTANDDMKPMQMASFSFGWPFVIVWFVFLAVYHAGRKLAGGKWPGFL